MKKECEIVKDLFPNYIENRINDTTKEYVEEHIKSCKSCADILRSIRSGKQDKNEENNEVVINSLKKYNRKMFILKIIVAILSIFIISIWGSLIVERVKNNIQFNKDYEKGQYIFGIIDKAYNKIEDIINSDNYSIVDETTEVNYDLRCVTSYLKEEIYYKEGYIKEKYTGNSGSIKSEYNNNYTNYGVIGKDKTFYIQRSAELNSSGFSIAHTTESTYNSLDWFHKEDVLEYKDFEIREETIAGKDYYIVSLREDRNDIIHDGIYNTEVWIDKDSMLLCKITYEKIGVSKREEKFTFSVNTIKDEDVKLEFAVENESSRKLMELIEKIGNGELEDEYEQAIRWDFSEDSSKVIFDKYESKKEIIMSSVAEEKAVEFMRDKYGEEAVYGYGNKGIVFDQNGDGYYAYEVYVKLEGKDKFEQNVFISIFGDTIKTNETEMDIKTGDMVIL